MNGTISKFLTLALITLVALPPGWCGACCRPTAEVVVAKASCCQHAQSTPASHSSQGCPRPVQSVGCCCTQPVIVPQQVVVDDHLLALPAPAVVDNVAAGISPDTNVVAQLIPPPGGLSLHILQCVWRC